MRLKPDAPWRPFTAEQTMSVRELGFVWVADMQLVPFLSARILDAYVADRGILEARLLGSMPLASSIGPQTDRGELMRYLAELVWVPQAMLHNPRLRWRELDENVFELSADSSKGPARVRLVFENGDVARVEADDRPRGEGDDTVPRRWTGRFSNYRKVKGYRIPTRGEASWVLDDGPFAYWRGEVMELETE